MVCCNYKHSGGGAGTTAHSQTQTQTHRMQTGSKQAAAANLTTACIGPRHSSQKSEVVVVKRCGGVTLESHCSAPISLSCMGWMQHTAQNWWWLLPATGCCAPPPHGRTGHCVLAMTWGAADMMVTCAFKATWCDCAPCRAGSSTCSPSSACSPWPGGLVFGAIELPNSSMP